MDVIKALMALKLQTNLSEDLNSRPGLFGLSSDAAERDIWEVFSKYGSLSDVCTVEVIPGCCLHLL